MRWQITLVTTIALAAASRAPAQPTAASAELERAAAAMGGLERLQALDNFVMTGFGQSLSQQGGAGVSGDPRAPGKWQAAHAVERSFDLRNARAVNEERRASLFPLASRSGQSWNLARQVQTGLAALSHPLPALLAALDPATVLGPVTVDEGRAVVQAATAGGETFWLAIDSTTGLPAWVRWIAPSTTLGDLTYTTHFTGYLPFDSVRLPIGLSTEIDWRNTTVAELHVDSYRLNVPGLTVPAAEAAAPAATRAVAVPLAEGVWDVRYGEDGGAVIEFSDHLVMFEAYASEEATFARLDLANTLVPGKEVTEVIVSHHHFDHSGGLRAAVARGLTIIAQRGNEPIFREMIARPAPNFPDALARDPQSLKFVPVDEHLVLEDETMRVDVYHVIGHLHMADAVFAYVPRHRIFLEGDMTTHDWEWHWWGGSYLDNVEHYGLDPAINVPVHGIVTTFAETVTAIEEQVKRAREFCAERASVGVWPAGCPVRYSRELD